MAWRPFQLTPSRKATAFPPAIIAMLAISTHAFTEGDTNCDFAVCVYNISTHAFTEGDVYLYHQTSETAGFQLTPSRKATRFRRCWMNISTNFNSRLHGRRLQIQIIFAAKHFLFLLILSKFLILAFLFHLASLRFSLHPVIFRCESPCIFLFIYLSHSKHVHSVIIFNLLHYISPLIFYQLKICFNLISLLFKINLLKFFVIFYWHRKMPVIKFIKF